MKKWLVKRQNGSIAHVFYQDDAPTVEFLNAFGDVTVEEVELPEEERIGYIRGLRAEAYPPLQELADAIVHQQMGDEEPMSEYIAKCQAVKDKYPLNPIVLALSDPGTGSSGMIGAFKRGFGKLWS